MLNLRPVLIIVLVVLFALFFGDIWYATKAHLPTEIGYLEDPGNRMDIAQASSPRISDRYTIKRDNRISLGFSRSSLWLRIDLEQTPPSGSWVLFIAAPWLDRIDFFLPDPEKGWLKQSTGLSQPSVSTTVGGFALDAPASTPRSGYAYLRVESLLALNAGLRIRPKTGFEQDVPLRAYIYGGLYGVMLAMSLFNFLVFLTLRDKTYIVYVLYLVSIIVHQFCLQGQILLLPMHLWPLVPTISLVVSACSFFFGTLFGRSFLNTKVHTPIFDRLLIGLQLAAIVLLVLALTGRLWWGTWLTHSLAVFGPLAAIVAGIQGIKRRYSPARIYLLAWMVMLFGMMAWGAWSMGWLDRLRPPQITLTIAAALESCLLTLAMAERVRMIHLEQQALVQRERRYRQLSITDELTGLFNHRYFWEKLSSAIEHALHLERPLSLVVLDLDDFKAVNDVHGHHVGDQLLTGVGILLKESLRPADSACRYGGEEFALILHGADKRVALEVAERVRRTLAKQVFHIRPDLSLTITASLGATQYTHRDKAKDLFQRADKYMYQAKTTGKNKVVYGSG